MPLLEREGQPPLLPFAPRNWEKPWAELRLFNQLAMLGTRNFDLATLVEQILYQVMKFLRVSAGLLLLRDPATGRLTQAASKGFPTEYLQQIKAVPLDEVLGSYLLQATLPLVIVDVDHDHRLDTSTFLGLIRDFPMFQALVSIPLRSRRQLLGFLNLAHTSPGIFSPEQKDFFLILGNQIGLVVQNARLYQALRRSEQNYRRIFEGSQDLIMVITPDGRFLDLNPAAVSGLGFTSRAAALTHGNLRDFFPDAREWDRLLVHLEKYGSVRALESTLMKPNYTLLPVLLSATARRDRQNRLLSIDLIAKDISDRKRSEYQLLAAKKLTEGILEGLPVPVFVIDRHHRVIYWNRACEELTGYPRQEMIGSNRHWLPFYAQPQPTLADLVVDQNIRAINDLYQGQEWQPAGHFPGAFEVKIRLAATNGGEKCFFLVASPIFNEHGQIMGAVQAMLDITHQEQLAQHLRESEEKYRLLVEGSLDGIALHTYDRLLFANPAFLRLFGYNSPEELVQVSLLQIIAPESYRPLWRYLRRIGRRLQPPRLLEIRGRKRDGSEFDIEMISFPTTFGSQPVFQTHVRDITEKKKLWEQLGRAEKLAAVGQLAAGIAHEINNPLGGILVYSYLLLEDLPPNRPERLQIEKIVREASRCKEIIRGLLDFSRQLPANFEPLNINSVIQETLNLVENHLLFQNVQIEQQLAPKLPPVLGDKSRLEQVFLNLFFNAAEAMNGHGRLLISTALREERLLEIRVSDTGPGIPPEHLPRIFDPFFTTKQGSSRGVGLGLSISYGIIKQHRGRIYVAPGNEAGTTFVVELPLARDQASAPA